MADEVLVVVKQLAVLREPAPGALLDASFDQRRVLGVDLAVEDLET